MSRIAIIGAGISGLVAAKDLQQRGNDVVVLEKSRSYSGRCSTRRWKSHIVDHGAQYFTATDVGFLEDLKALLGDGLKVIDHPVEDLQGNEIPSSGGKRYYYAAGNNRIGKQLAESIDVRREHLIESLALNDGKWQVAGETFDVVLVTTPWPQTMSLLGLSGKAPEVYYAPCLTAFFEYGGLKAGEPFRRYALSSRDPAEPLAWSACENVKVGRIEGASTVWVVQASEAFSREWLEAEPAAYLPHLQKRLETLWELDGGELLDTFAHRWRYARRIKEISIPELPAGIFVAGDSRVESKIQTVWLDGKRAAQEIQTFLTTD